MNAPHFAVDAANLARDRRGMGRLARCVLAAASSDGADVTLLADGRADRRALRGEFPSTPIRHSASARYGAAYDAVWFPFNGMRYRSAAPALVSMYDTFAFTFAQREPIARYREQAPMRRAARYATRIVTLSQWARTEIVRDLGIAAALIDVVTPTPEPFWSPGPSGESDASGASDALPPQLERRRIVLVVGASEKRKNVRLVLEACARALRAPDEVLVVVGALGEADRAYARGCGLAAGEIAASDDTLRALYRRAELVLVPSLAEGFGLVVIEAMACGAAVIAADASALPEAAGGAAVLLPPQERAAWTAAIRAYLDDPGRIAELRARSLRRFANADRTAGPRAVLAALYGVASGAQRMRRA